MSRFNLNKLFVKYLREECDSDQVAQIQSLRADPKNEAELTQIRDTLTLLSHIQKEEIKEPGVKLADSIMRKVRQTKAKPVFSPRFAWPVTAITALLICLFVIVPLQRPDISRRESIQVQRNSASGQIEQSVKKYPEHGEAVFNDDRISNSFDRILTFMEGSFAALVMVAFGFSSIVLALMAGFNRERKYQAAAGVFLLLTIAIFLLRSFISLFFNTSSSILG